MRFGGWGSQKETETQGFDGLGYLKVGDFGGFWSWGFGVVLRLGAGPRSEVRGLGFAKYLKVGDFGGFGVGGLGWCWSGWGLGLGQWGLGLGQGVRFGGWGAQKKRKLRALMDGGTSKVGDFGGQFGGFWSWGFGVVLGGAWGWANGALGWPRIEVRGRGMETWLRVLGFGVGLLGLGVGLGGAWGWAKE